MNPFRRRFNRQFSLILDRLDDHDERIQALERAVLLLTVGLGKLTGKEEVRNDSKVV